MKLAVPTRNDLVDDHFGHCAFYTIVTVENDRVIHQESLPSPEGCGCKSNIASVLQTMGVEVMLAGNMGEGAKRVLESHRIKVIRGCSGSVKEVLQAYLKGEISDSGTGCQHHEDADHQCPNH